MGDVVEMKRKVETRVRRFGHEYRVEYRAGTSPKITDPMAALYIDGELFTWLGVRFIEDDWGSIDLAIDDDYMLVTPEMVGMSPTTEDEKDHQFLIEAEDYLLALLITGLSGALGAVERPGEGPSSTPDPRHLHPLERASRAISTWHDHGRVEKMLPDLVAAEVYDALEAMGMSLAEAVDEHIEEGGERTECGKLIRALVEEAIQEWRGGEE